MECVVIIINIFIEEGSAIMTNAIFIGFSLRFLVFHHSNSFFSDFLPHLTKSEMNLN